MEVRGIVNPQTEFRKNLEKLGYELMLLGFERTAKNAIFDSKLAIKKSLLYLISFYLEELTEDNYNINLLGLSQQILSQPARIHFLSKDLLIIKEIYFQETNKLIKEISDSFLNLDFNVAAGLDIGTLLLKLQKLVLDVNAEVENNVESQKKLIHLACTNLEDKIKNAELSESNLLKVKKIASELKAKTWHTIYSSKECWDEIMLTQKSLEDELCEIIKEIESLQNNTKLYKELDQLEYKNIIDQYSDVMQKIKLREVSLKELSSLL